MQMSNLLIDMVVDPSIVARDRVTSKIVRLGMKALMQEKHMKHKTL